MYVPCDWLVVAVQGTVLRRILKLHSALQERALCLSKDACSGLDSGAHATWPQGSNGLPARCQ